MDLKEDKNSIEIKAILDLDLTNEYYRKIFLRDFRGKIYRSKDKDFFYIENNLIFKIIGMNYEEFQELYTKQIEIIDVSSSFSEMYLEFKMFK